MSKQKAKPSSRRKPATLRTSKPRKGSLAKAASVSARTATKHDRVLVLLRSAGGTTIAAMMRATGWQPHSVRGFLTGVVKRKLGLDLASEKTNSGRVYRIVGETRLLRRSGPMRKPGRRGASLQPKAIEEEIAHLHDLDLVSLRTRWQNEFGRPAPEHLTRYLLFRILAY
jgi:Protein of unknown function (DUF3489)